LDNYDFRLCLNPEFSTTRQVTTIKPNFARENGEDSTTIIFLPTGKGRKGEGGLRTKGYFKFSLPGKPLITVITVVFNGEKYLEETILSVINQSYDNVEYIVIDGGSSDKTIDIIGKHENAIDYWVSEQDKGVYDAMNKGISNATGDWVLFLGSDDIVSNVNTIQNIFDNENVKLNSYSKLDILVGNVMYKNNNYLNSSFSSLLKLRNTVHHQAAFYSRKIFFTFKYNSDFKISADYELNLKLFLEEAISLKVDQVVAICSPDGLSGLCSWVGYKEEINIRNQYLSSIESSIYNLLTILRFVFKKIDIIRKSIYTSCNLKG